MKREKLLLAMNLMDEKYIEEAHPKNAKKKFNWRRFTVIAASIAVVLTALNLWLFIPYASGAPDVSEYADSEYYPLIQKLNEYYYLQNYDEDAPKNNFEMLSAMLSDWSVSKNADYDYFGGDSFTIGDGADITQSVTTVAPGTPNSNTGQQYEEVTDNQVAGVIEADLMKRSDQYIYYLSGNRLYIYSIAGEDSRRIGEYTVSLTGNDMNASTDQFEFYLSADCQTITVIAPYYTTTDGFRSATAVISLDVSDPANITQKTAVYLNSDYMSSRLVNGTILLMGRYTISGTPDFANESTFVPQIDAGDGMQCIPMDGIVSPDVLNTKQYTVVCKLDEDTLELLGSAAFLSYSQEVYVSKENVYASRSYNNSVTEDDIITNTRMTEIACLSYAGESLDYSGSVTIAGTVKDQYSMDEYDGMLRVVTTTSTEKIKETNDGELASITFLQSSTNASLYCIDLSTWEVIAEVKDFAPEGETVQSVRFDGDAAYVCTAVVVTLSDPVFFFDLSDVNNITYKDTGTIEGFSTSLISFGDGYLIGIGVDDTGSGVKLEVYEETEDGVKSVCSYAIEIAEYSTDYKSYLIDRENQLIGLGITEYTGYYYETNYVLFQYEDGKLIPLNKTAISNYVNSINSARAFYDNGYLYLCSDAMFECKPLSLQKGE